MATVLFPWCQKKIADLQQHPFFPPPYSIRLLLHADDILLAINRLERHLIPHRVIREKKIPSEASFIHYIPFHLIRGQINITWVVHTFKNTSAGIKKKYL